MLLRIGVENHLSICERQELLLAASSLKDRDDGLIPCDAVDSRKLVPAAIIYGANASGKTNFVNAVHSMRSMVLWSHSRGEPGGRLPRHEFRLDPGWSEKPSCFDIDFVIDGIRYHYGFEAIDEAFASEWLYEIPKSHRRRMFERDGMEFEFGRSLKGQNSSIARLTRSNSLFLSAAAQNGHPQLSRLYEYFRGTTFVSSGSVPGIEASMEFTKAGMDARVIDFLKSINTGVVDYRLNEQEIPAEAREFRREIQAVRGKMSEGRTKSGQEDEGDYAAMELAHRGKGGRKVHLNPDLESAGTRRLLVVLSQAFKAIDAGLPMFIDELDASLHTYASEAVVRLFCSPKINRNGAQLVATTHDTNLMGSETLRRDQLWFTEKNTEGATEIYPLTDIRTRKEDNVELGYLQGRYGAVPTEDPVAKVPATI